MTRRNLDLHVLTFCLELMDEISRRPHHREASESGREEGRIFLSSTCRCNVSELLGIPPTSALLAISPEVLPTNAPLPTS